MPEDSTLAPSKKYQASVALLDSPSRRSLSTVCIENTTLFHLVQPPSLRIGFSLLFRITSFIILSQPRESQASAPWTLLCTMGAVLGPFSDAYKSISQNKCFPSTPRSRTRLYTGVLRRYLFLQPHLGGKSKRDDARYRYVTDNVSRWRHTNLLVRNPKLIRIHVQLETCCGMIV